MADNTQLAQEVDDLLARPDRRGRRGSSWDTSRRANHAVERLVEVGSMGKRLGLSDVDLHKLFDLSGTGKVFSRIYDRGKGGNIKPGEVDHVIERARELEEIFKQRLEARNGG